MRTLKLLYDPWSSIPRKGETSTPQQSSTTQTSEPWSEQKDYLKDVFAQAQRRYYGPNPIDARTGLPASQNNAAPSQWTQQSGQWVDQYGNTVGPQTTTTGGSSGAPDRYGVGESGGGGVGSVLGGGGTTTTALGGMPGVSYYGPNQQGGGDLDFSSGNYLPDPNADPQFYPESTVVPFSDQTEQALQGMEARAAGGSDIQRLGSEGYQSTLQGDYLNSNPYFDEALRASLRPMVENYQNVVMPGVQSAFSKSGRYGANSHNAAVGQVTDDLFQNIGDTASKMSFANYDAERNRQQQAIFGAPEYAQQDYLDLERLAQVGGAREGQDQAQLQDKINRHNFNTSREDAMLSQYMGLINGNFGGTTQTTQQVPYYTGNQWAGPVGAATSAAGALGSLIGK